jgi:predicted nucleic acid-binding protein
MALLAAVQPRPARRGPWASAATSSLVCGLLLLGGPVAGQTAPSKAYQVKAVFLFNFTQFVEWPAAAFGGATSPIVIGVLGENPFGDYLDDTVRGEKVERRTLEVQRYRRVDEIVTCHVLFISQSEEGHLEEILAALKDRSILVVGDADDFVERGGMIRLATAGNRIRLIISVAAATAAHLTISSQLLRAGELVSAKK